MDTRGSRWWTNTALLACIVLSVSELSSADQPCGGIIDAGSGVIRSPNYPNTYPSSASCTWTVLTGEEYHIRIEFKDLNCRTDSLRIYNGRGTVSTALIGEYCNHGDGTMPPSIDSTGNVLTISFVTSEGEQANDKAFVLSYESIDVDALGPRVIWTETRSTGPVVVNTIVDDMLELFTAHLQQQPIPGGGLLAARSGNWTALDVSYGQHKIIWSISHLKAIITGNLTSALPINDIGALSSGTSSLVLGIAVDWLTGNVYYTDASYDWIIVLNANGSRNFAVIDEDLDIPTGIAVHPLRGFLFWTDSGSHPKVERSNLAGDDRVTIASEGVVLPKGIAVDYQTDKIYWVDADPSNNRIEMSDVDGGNRRILYESQNDHGLFDLTISGEIIYATGSESGSVLMIQKGSGAELLSISSAAAGWSTRRYSIAAYSPGVQPPAYSPCQSNPCTNICVGDGGSGYICICGSGQLLAADGHTCERERLVGPPRFLAASASKLCFYSINMPDISQFAASNSSKCVEGLPTPLAVAVDVEDGEAFHSVAVGRLVKRLTVRQDVKVDLVSGGSRSVRGIAADWVTKHLYWTDYARGTVEVAKYDGSYRTTLLSDIQKAGGIVLDPKEKLLFWVSTNRFGQIERASLDGTERVVIATRSISVPFFIPTGLAIDCDNQRLYYADRLFGVIESMDYDGENMVNILRKPGANFFDIALFKDYLLWSELGRTEIFSANIHTGEMVGSYSTGEQVFGITTYANSRQKIVHSPCRVNNGGCDQLCLSSRPSTRGYVCKCSLGYRLAEDGVTCLSDLVEEDFLLVTDTYQRTLFQIDLHNPQTHRSALSAHSLKNPIAVTFDPIDRKVYWTDVEAKTLSRASLDVSVSDVGSDQEVIAFNQIQIPDGVAIDPISRLLYWTDGGTHAISVAHLDGSDRKTLIEGLQIPRAIVLHPADGVMFWTDWGENPSIERSNMDGSSRSVIVSSGLRWPNGLALDYQGGRLYWCDAGVDKIESIDFRGRNRRVIIDFGYDAHPYDIAVVGNFIYWADWNLHSLLRADKLTGRGNATIGPQDYARPNSVFAVTRSAMPSGTTRCSAKVDGIRGECSGLCLPRGRSRTCACADGYLLEGDGSCILDESMVCPLIFTSGSVRAGCVPRPGRRCSVQCQDGLIPAVDEIVCLPGGRWDLNELDLCLGARCPPLEAPPHVDPGPCSSPYLAGTQCTHECEQGYAQTGGNKRRTCSPSGEWLGTPIVCQERGGSVPSECDPTLGFIERPIDVEAGLDQLVSVNCEVNRLDATAKLLWYKNGRALTSGDDISVGPRSLTIPLYQRSHEGIYACVVSSGNQECLRAEANFSYNPLLTFRTTPRDVVISARSHVFHCSPKLETDTVTWLKSDRPINTGTASQGKYTILGNNLVLRYLTEEDEGKYTCVLRASQRGQVKGHAHAWLYLSEPSQIDISQVCGKTVVDQGSGATTTPTTPIGALDWSSASVSSSDAMIHGVDEDENIGRSIGGKDVLRGSAPYMVRIWSVRRRKFECGGTLLDQEWVLTAAHCLRNRDYGRARLDEIKLYLGDFDSERADDSEDVREATEIRIHEDFNNTYFSNDIALIRMSRPLRKFTNYVRPICLAPQSLSTRLLRPENEGRVTGWGRTKLEGQAARFPKDVLLPFIPRDHCLPTTDFPIPINLFCAGYLMRQEDACKGDSGGPYAMQYEDGRWYQLGIVSSGEGCATQGKYGYYTDLARYIPWLRANNVNFASSPEVEEWFPFRPDSLPTQLAFTRKSSNMTVAVGSEVYLECFPNRGDAQVTWLIHRKELTSALQAELDYGVSLTSTGLRLHFRSVEVAYSGWYGCQVSVTDDTFGEPLSAEFYLEVTS